MSSYVHTVTVIIVTPPYQKGCLLTGQNASIMKNMQGISGHVEEREGAGGFARSVRLAPHSECLTAAVDTRPDDLDKHLRSIQVDARLFKQNEILLIR